MDEDCGASSVVADQLDATTVPYVPSHPLAIVEEDQLAETEEVGSRADKAYSMVALYAGPHELDR
jgi:hypothetical protein